MAFNIFDLGPASGQLQEYADINNQIPEPGDSWEDFKWPHSLARKFAHKETGAKCWQEFLAEAVAATARAIDTLAALEY